MQKENPAWVKHLRMGILLVPIIPALVFALAMRAQFIESGSTPFASTTFELWIPKNAKVFTDQEQWRKIAEPMEPRQMVTPDNYKEWFGNEEHLVFVGPREATYLTRQGKVVMTSQQRLTPPKLAGVRGEVKNLGHGEFAWIPVDDFGSLLMGMLWALVAGALLDLAGWAVFMGLHWVYMKDHSIAVPAKTSDPVTASS